MRKKALKMKESRSFKARKIERNTGNENMQIKRKSGNNEKNNAEIVIKIERTNMGYKKER